MSEVQQKKTVIHVLLLMHLLFIKKIVLHPASAFAVLSGNESFSYNCHSFAGFMPESHKKNLHYIISMEILDYYLYMRRKPVFRDACISSSTRWSWNVTTAQHQHLKEICLCQNTWDKEYFFTLILKSYCFLICLCLSFLHAWHACGLTLRPKPQPWVRCFLILLSAVPQAAHKWFISQQPHRCKSKNLSDNKHNLSLIFRFKSTGLNETHF